MPRLVVRLAVALAVAVVAMTGFEALSVRRSLSGRRALRPADAATPPVTAAPRFELDKRFVAEATRYAQPRRSLLGMARIHGRVVGALEDASELSISIEDSRHRYEPELDHGNFEINLPPGSYTIEAHAGDDVAVAEVPDLFAEEDREVVLQLAAGVTIGGRIDGCDGPCTVVTVHVEAPGSDHEIATVDSDDNGEFVASGLVPGRAYDVRFEAAERRPLTVHGISAPRLGLLVTLEPTRSLAGAFGLSPGQKCPLQSITLRGLGPDGTPLHSRFDRACRFRFDELPEVDKVRVTTEGDGWSFDVEVTLPAHGDPPFLCLHPTCRDREREPKAKLIVNLQGASAESGYVILRYPDGDETGSGCGFELGQCALDGLPTGAGVAVTAATRGCEPRTFTVDLQAGPNYLAFACERMRSIDGVLRGRLVGTEASVRCSNEHIEQPLAGRLFQLRCPARLAAIEYRLRDDAAWQKAPIASEDSERGQRGFVDITAN